MGISKIKAVLFRTDASSQIGTGHLMRCLALAQGLVKTGIQSVFVIRDHDSRISELIRRKGFDVNSIPADCSQAEDLRLALEYADHQQAKLIVTDLGHVATLTHQNEYREYLQGLKMGGRFLVTIDDLSEMSFSSDIVINPNCGAEKLRYPAGSKTEFLLGPTYFIFSPEFIAAAGKKRNIKKKATNILIAMSGSDPLDLTGKVARSLAASKKTGGLNLRFVLGMDYTESKILKLKTSLAKYSDTYELLQGVDNMAELMLWADIAITGGGLTKYEAAVTGTPCIIIPQYDYLVKLSEEFAACGTTLNLGLGEKLKDHDIAEAVANLLGDSTRRTVMSRKGKELVDGRGIERIISKIPAEIWR